MITTAVEIVTYSEFPGRLVYAGDGQVPSVYELTHDQFADLVAGDSWSSMDSDWRKIEDSGALENMQRRWLLVNGRWMKGWVTIRMAGSPVRFASLLQYMQVTLGATDLRQIAAVAAGLSALNLCSIAELFARYQPVSATGNGEEDPHGRQHQDRVDECDVEPAAGLHPGQ